MAKQPAAGFAELLQRFRVRAGMTQDELATAAEISPRTVSDLERGINRTARKDTAGAAGDRSGPGRARAGAVPRDGPRQANRGRAGGLGRGGGGGA